jgi:hypothetical protein
MKNIKTVLLIVVAVVLLAGTIYLAILIQDESKNTGAINTRASDPESQTLAYKSITGAVTPSPTLGIVNQPFVPPAEGGVTPTTILTPTTTLLQVSPSPTRIPTTVPSPTPTFGNQYNVTTQITTPTPLPKQLPVAGIADQLALVMVAASALMIFAFVF